MKSRLNITIESNVLRSAKKVAQARAQSLSQLIEDYLVHLQEDQKAKPFHIEALGTLGKASFSEQPSPGAAMLEGKRKKYGL